MEYLLIDGYNVINAWRDLFDPQGEPLEDCREKLLAMLSNYQGFMRLNIIVVFDAHMVKGSQEKEYEYDHLKVVFTKENETADNYIEKFVHRLGNTYTIRVVTSDYLEQTMVLSNGGIRMSPRELREEIGKVEKNGRPDLIRPGIRSNSIASHIKPELLEKLEKIRRDKF